MTERDRNNSRRMPVQRAAERDERENIVYGRNSVMELLKSDRGADKLFVLSGQREGSITTIVALAVKKKIPVLEVGKKKLSEICATENHQGVAASCPCVEYVSVDDILSSASSKGEKPLVVVADGVEDPRNLGAIIRCAECAGAHGLIISKRRSATVTPTAVKASAGACSYLPIAKVSNIASCIDELKEKGLWIFSAEAGGDDVFDTDFNCAAAIVMGGEDGGVSPLVKSKSDYIISIPMYGNINSLNVSAAAAVILNVAAHKRRSTNG